MHILVPILTAISLLGFAQISTAANTNATTSGTLVLGILNIESSYAQSTERPSRGVPDTVQFWFGSGQSWRIRTYAIDHDIHPHRLGDLAMAKERPTEFASEHIKKHYGDVLASLVVLVFTNTGDTNAVQQLLTKHSLQGRVENADKLGFAFWNPDNGYYRSQTTPK